MCLFITQLPVDHMLNYGRDCACVGHNWIYSA